MLKRGAMARVQTIQSKVRLLTRACTQILSSTKLKRLLEAVLDVSNVLNQGEREGRERGVSVSVVEGRGGFGEGSGRVRGCETV